VLEHLAIVAQKSGAWNHVARCAQVTTSVTELRENRVRSTTFNLSIVVAVYMTC
jgi:hypothetical protein